MKTLTAEWVAKAEGDFATMQRERRVRKNPNYDGVCFHAQQCVEKYLKAILQDSDLPIEKTHDLTVLLSMVVPVAPLLESFRETMNRLGNFAVVFRYPGDFATKEDATVACTLCSSVRDEIRTHLGCTGADKTKRVVGEKSVSARKSV